MSKNNLFFIFTHGTKVAECWNRPTADVLVKSLRLLDETEMRAPAQCALDTERLDWLDKVNTATNERVGTCYGWKFDINHNRASLSDHNLPALHVRAAIDAARGYAVTSTECGEPDANS